MEEVEDQEGALCVWTIQKNLERLRQDFQDFTRGTGTDFKSILFLQTHTHTHTKKNEIMERGRMKMGV